MNKDTVLIPFLNNDNKRVARNTLLLYVRTLLVMLVTLYTSRVVLSILGAEDFGIYDVTASVVALFAFINAAMASSTQRYLNYELGKGAAGRLKTVFSTSILIHAAISLLILIIGETVGLWFLQHKMIFPAGRTFAAFWVYQLSVFSSVVNFLGIPYYSVIIAYEKMSAFAYISLFEALGKLTTVFLLYWAPCDKLIVYALFGCIIQLLVRLIYYGYCRKNFAEARFSIVWDRKLFRNMLSFCGWNLFGNIAQICLLQGTNVLLNLFFNPVVNAAKGISAQVQMALMQLCQNFQVALNPQLVRSYAENKLPRTRRLIFFSSRISFYLLLLLSLPVLMETEQLLRLWLRNVPEYSAVFVRLSVVVAMFQTLANPLVMGNAATGNVRTLMITVGLLFWAVIPLSYLGLKLGGAPTTVFTVQIGLMLAAHAIRIKIVGKQLNFSFPDYCRGALNKIALVLILCLIPPYLAMRLMDESPGRFLLVLATSAASVGVAAFFAGLTPDERTVTKKIIIKKISRR
jgi:O-antigen/teichoic acid export membrane protein